MDRATMEQLVGHDLGLIPEGDLAQQTLRMTYSARRKHDLKENDPPRPPGEIFREAVADARKEYPGFMPTVTDPEYFDLNPGEYQLRE